VTLLRPWASATSRAGRLECKAEQNSSRTVWKLRRSGWRTDIGGAAGPAVGGASIRLRTAEGFEQGNYRL